jgi:hypothetical protein
MEHLSNLLSSLNIQRPTQNLEFVNFDPHHSHAPQFKVEHNDLYLLCQSLVISAICIYSCFFQLPKLQKALYGYRRSKSDPAAAETFLLRYDVEPFEPIKDEHYYFALDYVIELFRPRWLIHPVHFTDLRFYPWKLDTSAERPFTTEQKYKDYTQARYKSGLAPNASLKFSNLYTPIFEFCRTIVHRIKEGELLDCPDHIQMHVKPALVSTDEPDKVRSVWGMPKYFIFIEAMFFWPLFSHYFTVKHTPLLWNYESLNGGWYRLNAEYYERYSSFKTLFNTDWSEFDMRFYFSIWQDILDKVKTFFCFCGRYCPTTLYPKAHTDPTRLHNLWSWLNRNYFAATCASPLGKVYRRLFAGMPSGIFCTQFFDSIYNGIMIVTCLRALGITITDDLLLKLMGDDALFGLLFSIPVLEWADFLEALRLEALKRFNARLSITKSKGSLGIQGATVLSYVNNNGYPTRDHEDLLAHLLHPKTMRDTPQRLMARAIGIYYASGGHRYFRAICKHIYDVLELQGYSPSVKGLASLYDPLGIRLTDDDLLRFPTETEVIARLLRPSRRDEDVQSKYWNRDHFIFESGLAPHED